MTHILLPRDLPQDRDQMTIRLLALALLALRSVAAKQCQGEDLPSDAALRIGVKKRVPECATKASKGQQLSMHYRGYLYSSCEEFDSSYGRDEPFEFTLGTGAVIQGWDQGLVGMCVGEQRKLTIPGALGYGEAGSPPTIPSNATLVFEVELLDAKMPKKSKKKSKKKKKKKAKDL